MSDTQPSPQRLLVRLLTELRQDIVESIDRAISTVNNRPAYGASTRTCNRRFSTASTASTRQSSHDEFALKEELPQDRGSPGPRSPQPHMRLGVKEGSRLTLKSPHPRRASVRRTSQPYSRTLISNLRVGSTDWCLRGRVVSKSEIFGISTGELFHAHISDEDSNTVKLLFFDEAAHIFHDSIQIGAIYYFRNGKVLRAHSKFNKEADVEIKFDTSAVIEAADDIKDVTELD